MLFCEQTDKMHLYYHWVTVTAEPLFICTRIDHMD